MYSTCLFCHAALGANDSIEHFPVGQRLAFDGERGRLWAVCPRCHQWNLAPIEARWEALEACEKAYRSATRRVSTDNIALARLKDGTDLVRIGQPLLPEFAAWRYGGELLARHRRMLRWAYVPAALAVASVVAHVAGRGMLSSSMLAALGMGVTVLQVGPTARILARVSLPRAVVASGGNDLRALSTRDALRSRIRLEPDGRWQLGVRSRSVSPAPIPLQRLGIRFLWAGSSARESWYEEVAALQVLPRVLSVVHFEGADADTVRSAVDVVVDRIHGRDDPVERSVAALLGMPERGVGRHREYADGRPLDAVPLKHRLAVAMALHEDDERRALAGELGALYARWEEAERIARIADGELTRVAPAE